MNAEVSGVQWWVLIAGTALLILAIVPAYGILLEWRQVRWRDSEIGHVLRDKSLVIAVILSFQLLGITLMILGHGRPLWFEMLRLVTFGWLVWILWRQWFIYRKVRRSSQTRV